MNNVFRKLILEFRIQPQDLNKTWDMQALKTHTKKELFLFPKGIKTTFYAKCLVAL